MLEAEYRDSEDDDAVSEAFIEDDPQRSLRIVLAITFTISAATCGLGINALFKSESWLPMTTIYATAAVCLTVFVGAIIPKDMLPRLLVVYLVLLLFESLLLLVAGGLCLVLTDDIVAFLELENNENLELLGTESTNLSTELFILGGLSVGLSCLLLDVMRRIGGMLGELHAMVTILQTMNMMSLPIGLLTIAMGLYFADTINNTVAGLNIAATVIIGIGAILFAVNFLGFLASAVASRSLMGIYSTLLIVLMSTLLCIGISSLVLAPQVQEFVTAEWSTIRFVLPPTFVGRYDQDAFSAWVTLNLKVVGFASIMTGLFCAAMLIVSFALRHTFLIEREQRAKRLGIVLDNVSTYGGDLIDALSGTVGSENKGWMHLNKKHRFIAKFVGSCGILSLLVPVGLLQSLYMYDTYCESIAEVDVSFTKNSTVSFASINTLEITNQYPIGFTKVTLAKQGNPLSTTLNIRAAKEGYQSESGLLLNVLQSPNKTGTAQISSLPSDAVRLMNRDVTCQVGRLLVEVPSQVGQRNLNVTSHQDVTVEFLKSNGDPSSLQVFEMVTLESLFGQVKYVGSGMGEVGGKLTSSFGKIYLEKSNTICDPVGQPSRVVASSGLGSITIKDSSVLNCNLFIDSLAGPMTLEKVHVQHDEFSSSYLDSSIRIENSRGSIKLNEVGTDWLYSTGTEGNVRATKVQATRGVAIATTLGSILFGSQTDVGLELGADGVVQLETTAGDVVLHLSVKNGYFGRFSIDTGKGNKVIVSGSSVSETDRFTPSIDSAADDVVEGVSVSGNINCAGNKCNYGGEIIISSESGDIALFVSFE